MWWGGGGGGGGGVRTPPGICKALYRGYYWKWKNLVIFHICALPQLYVKVGPPLEKFSGSAPGYRAETNNDKSLALGSIYQLQAPLTEWIDSFLILYQIKQFVYKLVSWYAFPFPTQKKCCN